MKLFGREVGGGEVIREVGREDSSIDGCEDGREVVREVACY